jgi:N-acetylmuramoyl-L-alanine amidase
MTYQDRLRRRLLRAAVRENADALRGRLPRPLRRARRIGRTLLVGYRLSVGPALLFLAVGLLAAGGSDGYGAPPRTDSLEALSARLAVATPAVSAAAFPLPVKKIVLDPGHGGADPGALAGPELAEKDLTLDVARRLAGLLREASFDVLLTREYDETLPLRGRAWLANRVRGDLFVSIHVNAIPSREDCGIETYYLGATDDPRIAELAGVENRESGYSLADFRRLLEGVYVHARQRESRHLADVVQRGLVTFLRRGQPDLKDSGVKSAPFFVLVATEMPGVLTELSCLSNDDQARALADPGYRQNIARGLFVGIRAYADARNRPGGKGSL